MQPPDDANSFPVHGGTCTVVENPRDGVAVVDERDRDPDAVVVDADIPDDGFVLLRQTVLRHLHVVFWLVAVASVVAAAATAFTDWRYVSGAGRAYGWLEFLALGFVVPALRTLQVGWRRLRGYTGAARLSFGNVESVELTTTAIRWYAKTSKTVPLFVLTYRTDGTRKRRRIMLKRRWTGEDLVRAVDAFRDAGLRVRVDDDARPLLADARD